MKISQSPVPVESLRAMLCYEPATGLLKWIQRPAPRSRRRAGDIAGCIEKRSGVVIVRVPGYRSVLAHRAIWAMVHGAWPAELIDHIDGNPTNNRVENLRAANHRINSENRRQALRRPGGTGFLGVVFSKNGYQAQIGVRGRHLYLGRFDTPQAAHEVYLEAKRRLHEGNTL